MEAGRKELAECKERRRAVSRLSRAVKPRRPGWRRPTCVPSAPPLAYYLRVCHPLPPLAYYFPDVGAIGSFYTSGQTSVPSAPFTLSVPSGLGSGLSAPLRPVSPHFWDPFSPRMLSSPDDTVSPTDANVPSGGSRHPSNFPTESGKLGGQELQYLQRESYLDLSFAKCRWTQNPSVHPARSYPHRPQDRSHRRSERACPGDAFLDARLGSGCDVGRPRRRSVHPGSIDHLVPFLLWKQPYWTRGHPDSGQFPGTQHA